MNSELLHMKRLSIVFAKEWNIPWLSVYIRMRDIVNNDGAYTYSQIASEEDNFFQVGGWYYPVDALKKNLMGV